MVACNVGGDVLFVPETAGLAILQVPSSAMLGALNIIRTTLTSKSLSQALLFFLNSNNFLLEIFICSIGNRIPHKMGLLTPPLICL